MKGGIDADILVSGSSRAVYHYDPRVIESYTGKKSFNIGRDGSKPDEQLALLKAYLRHNRKPQYLIQSLDVINLKANDGVTDPMSFVGWLDQDELYVEARSHKRYFMVYRYFPLVGFMRTGAMKPSIEALLGHTTQAEGRLNGYHPQDKAWNDDFEAFRRQHPNGVTWPIEPAGRGALEDILELCRKEGISVILVYSPEYRECQELTVNRDKVFSVFQDISAKFNLPFWDYSQDAISSERAYFYNSSHLNRQGATVFSQVIAARLGGYFEASLESMRHNVTSVRPSTRGVGRGPEGRDQ